MYQQTATHCKIIIANVVGVSLHCKLRLFEIY